MHRCNGKLDPIHRCHIFLIVRISRSYSHCSPSSCIVRVEVWYLNQQTGFEFSAAPDHPSVITFICYLAIAGAPGTRIAKQFGIFTESTMMDTLQSIAQENHYQLLDAPETDPAQYISNHPWIERLSKRFWVDVWYPKRQLAYCRLTWRILPSISSLRNAVQAHLRSTLLLRSIVPDLTPHTYSKANFDELPPIVIIWSQTRHASEPCIPTSHYPWPVHFAPSQAYFLPSSMVWICDCQHTQCVIIQILNFEAKVRHIPLGRS